jgi:hypothetical protein
MLVDAHSCLLHTRSPICEIIDTSRKSDVSACPMAMNFKIRCRLSPVLFLELVEFPNAYALSRVNFIGGGWIPAWVLVPFVFDLGVDCRWFNHAPPDRDDSPIPSDGELYPDVVDACEEEGGVPSRLIKTDAGVGRQEGTPCQMFAGSPLGRMLRVASRLMISLGRARAG